MHRTAPDHPRAQQADRSIPCMPQFRATRPAGRHDRVMVLRAPHLVPLPVPHRRHERVRGLLGRCTHVAGRPRRQLSQPASCTRPWPGPQPQSTPASSPCPGACPCPPSLACAWRSLFAKLSMTELRARQGVCSSEPAAVAARLLGGRFEVALGCLPAWQLRRPAAPPTCALTPSCPLRRHLQDVPLLQGGGRVEAMCRWKPRRVHAPAPTPCRGPPHTTPRLPHPPCFPAPGRAGGAARGPGDAGLPGVQARCPQQGRQRSCRSLPCRTRSTAPD